MNMEFTKIAEGENLENILKLWKDACATEELYSLQRGEKNNIFLQGYETEFKPFCLTILNSLDEKCAENWPLLELTNSNK